jgi:nucleoside-diphosphate-sugar epimerase
VGKIALFGAAGAIGNSVADALRAQQRPYRVVGRSRGGLAAAFGSDPLAEIAVWNPDDPASVRAAASGIETIVYLVGVPYNEFRLHPIVIRQTLEGAIAAGVQNVLLIGTVYPYGLPRTPQVSEDHPREPQTFKGRMRKQQEDLVLAAHADGKIHGTILRLPDFYGPDVERSLVYGILKAAVDGGRAQVVGPIDTPHEYMYVPDVGPVVVALVEKPAAYGRFWNLAGPGTITQREFARLAFAHVGRTPKLIVANKLMLQVVGLFDPIMRELVEMHYLQTNPVIMNDDALTALLGGINKTAYADGIAKSIDSMLAEKPAAV